MKNKIKLKKIARYDLYDLLSNGIVCVFAVLNIFPLYWMVSNSFKASNEVTQIPPTWFPFPIRIKNYILLFEQSDIWYWFFNSVVISVGTTVLILIVSSLASYSFAKLKFFGKNIIFLIFISTLMIPKEVYIVPLIKVVQYFGLSGTYIGVMLPNVALPFGVFLLRNFFVRVPNEIRESAQIDGCSEFKIFRTLMLPLCKPGLAALGILQFVTIWNDYLWQLAMSSGESLVTLQIGLASLQNDNAIDYGVRMAGASIVALPMLVAFLVFQKQFTRGLNVGSVKG